MKGPESTCGPPCSCHWARGTGETCAGIVTNGWLIIARSGHRMSGISIRAMQYTLNGGNNTVMIRKVQLKDGQVYSTE